MTLDDLLKKLRSECEAAGGQGIWANKHGISAQYVSDVLRCGRKPGPAILKALKLKLVERYEKE
jgi:hypothetical protein